MLRDIIDVSMEIEYGEDWVEDRLSACGCKGLLGKWRKRGGFVIEHADYAHYKDIMTHPEHFEAIFSAGFSDTDELRELIDKAGDLRAASHHAREFTKEDLRDLRLVWTSLEKGLLALTPDQDIDYY
ncbi:hypothetical protein TSO5_08915 [Azospirillum sp. TSO5]|nr:hypothetical protein TSO5_08915 [Azospirillum sp. TSO5]